MIAIKKKHYIKEKDLWYVFMLSAQHECANTDYLVSDRTSEEVASSCDDYVVIVVIGEGRSHEETPATSSNNSAA